MEHGLAPGGQSLKEKLPLPSLHQKPAIVRTTLQHKLSQCLGVLFAGIPSRLLFYLGGGLVTESFYVFSQL